MWDQQAALPETQSKVLKSLEALYPDMDPTPELYVISFSLGRIYRLRTAIMPEPLVEDPQKP